MGWRKILKDAGVYNQPRVLTGTADVDVSASDYTGYIALLTITPTGNGLIDLRIALDLNKATTGLDAVSTASDTIDLAVVSKVDGTNYRGVTNATQVTTAGNGTLAANANGVSFHIGPVDVNEVIQVQIKLNAERGDAEVPYRITYIGSTPTVTAVAAG